MKKILISIISSTVILTSVVVESMPIFTNNSYNIVAEAEVTSTANFDWQSNDFSQTLKLKVHPTQPIAFQQGSSSKNTEFSKEQINTYIDYPTDQPYWHELYFGPTKNSSDKIVSSKIGESSCLLLSLVNSVYYKTNELLNPLFLADLSLKLGDRSKNVPNSGIDPSFIRDFATMYGSEYNFSYNKITYAAADVFDEIKQKNSIAISNIKGHWIALVDYRLRDDGGVDYLVLDSSSTSKRCSSIKAWDDKGVAWISQDILEKDIKNNTYGINQGTNIILSFDKNLPINYKNQLVSGNKYQIVHVGSNKCLTVKNKSNGAPLQIYDENHYDQIFELKSIGNNQWVIINSNTKKCIEVRNSAMEDRGEVGQWEFDDINCQKWFIEKNNDGTFLLKNANSNLFLNVEGNVLSNGVRCIQYHFDNTDAEKFKFIPADESSPSIFDFYKK